MTPFPSRPSANGPSLDRRLLQEAHATRRPLLLAFGAITVMGAAILAQAWLLSQAISRAFIEGTPLSALRPLFIALAGVIVVRALLGYLASVNAAGFSIGTRVQLRRRYVAHLHALGPAFTRAERSGDLVLAATEGVEKLDGYFRDYLPAAYAALVIPLLILITVFPLDRLTFAILLITGPLIPLFMTLIGSAAGTLARQQFNEMRLLGAHFVDVMQGLTTLKIFNRSRHQLHTIARVTDDFRAATMRVLRVAFLSAFTLELLATLSVAVVAVEIGVRLVYGNIPFATALFLLVIAPEFYLPLRNLGARFHNATEGKAVAERIFAVLDTPAPQGNLTPRPPLHAGEGEALQTDCSPSPAWRGGRGVRLPCAPLTFQNVTVHYPTAFQPALRDLTLTIAAGERVALVGPSGSGKTTIANLLLRFIAPTGGRISVNGQELATIPVEVWRRQIGWMAQAPYLFNATVAENIRLANPGASDAAVENAARAAGAHDFITRLPSGYATLCGERGLRLSGGQAQRVALARALLPRCAPADS